MRHPSPPTAICICKSKMEAFEKHTASFHFTFGESTHRDGTFPINVDKVLSLILLAGVNQIIRGRAGLRTPLMKD